MVNQQLKLCAWCGFREATDVHHLIRRSADPSLIDNPLNHIELCRVCHDLATNSKEFERILQVYFIAKQDEPKITLEYIAGRLKDADFLSPRDIVKFRNWLAGEYFFLSARYIEAKMSRTALLEKERRLQKSMVDAELQVDNSDTGRDFVQYKYLLKAIEEIQSALFTAIRQHERERNNSYD